MERVRILARVRSDNFTWTDRARCRYEDGESELEVEMNRNA